jgi:hypothetical protein
VAASETIPRPKSRIPSGVLESPGWRTEHCTPPPESPLELAAEVAPLCEPVLGVRLTVTGVSLAAAGVHVGSQTAPIT